MIQLDPAADPRSADSLSAIAKRWLLHTRHTTPRRMRNVASCLGRFEAFCEATGLKACPASGDTVTAFANHLVAKGHSAATIRSYVVAIRQGHQALGLPDPLPQGRPPTRPKHWQLDQRFREVADLLLDPRWWPADMRPAPGDETALPAPVGLPAVDSGVRASNDLRDGLDLVAILEKTGISRGTYKNYRVRLAYFAAWCHEQGLRPFPATVDTVARYLAVQAKIGVDGEGQSPITVRLTANAIRHVHLLRGLPDPSAEPRVRRVLQSHTSQWTKPPQQARPLSTEEVTKICRVIDQKGGLLGLRDKALILMTFAGCFRRSETTSRVGYDWDKDGSDVICLKIEDIEFDKSGMAIHLRKTKTENVALGHLPVKYINYGVNPHTCPVTAVALWIKTLRRYGITTGALFRPMVRAGCRVGGVGQFADQPLTPQRISLALKHYATLAGLPDVDRISAHSLRHGHVVAALDRGADILEIAAQGRWMTLEMLQRYSAQRQQRLSNSSQKLGL